jgi:hypothetical protein
MEIFKTNKIHTQWNNEGIVRYVQQLICNFQQHFSQQHIVAIVS